MLNGVTMSATHSGKGCARSGVRPTLQCIGFLVYGARDHLEIDPKLELDAPKGGTDDEKVLMGI